MATVSQMSDNISVIRQQRVFRQGVAGLYCLIVQSGLQTNLVDWIEKYCKPVEVFILSKMFIQNIPISGFPHDYDELDAAEWLQVRRDVRGLENDRTS